MEKPRQETDILAVIRDLAFQQGLFEVRKKKAIMAGKTVLDATMEALSTTWPMAFSGRGAVALGTKQAKCVQAKTPRLVRLVDKLPAVDETVEE